MFIYWRNLFTIRHKEYLFNKIKNFVKTNRTCKKFAHQQVWLSWIVEKLRFCQTVLKKWRIKEQIYNFHVLLILIRLVVVINYAQMFLPCYRFWTEMFLREAHVSNFTCAIEVTSGVFCKYTYDEVIPSLFAAHFALVNHQRFCLFITLHHTILCCIKIFLVL